MELGFANRQQAKFFDSRAWEILYSGAFGAGKSRILCRKAHALALQYPKCPIAIVRKVAASLAATTQLTFMNDVLKPSGVPYRQNKSQHWVEYPNGSRVWFFGLDTDLTTGIPSKIGSFDAAFIFVDEAVELDEADWILLLGRLRSQASDYRQIGAATNPADPSHWLIQRFRGDSPKRELLHARTSDNLLLPADYQERMADFPSGIFRSRYVEGEWVSISGSIFRKAWLQRINMAPLNGIRRVGVDLNASIKTHADFTAVVETVTEEHVLYVVGAWRARLDHGHREWLLDGPPHLSNGRTFGAIRIEAVAYQSAFAAEMLHTTDLPIQPVHPDKDKVNRAMALAARYEQGKVFHVAGAPGIEELEGELLGFPTGGHDDLVDALVYAADASTSYAGAIVGSN